MAEISPETIEPIITKLALTDQSYTRLLSTFFKKEFFRNKDLGQIIEDISKYFNKYNKIPSSEIHELMLEKRFAAGKQGAINLVESVKLLEYDKDDSKYVNDEVLAYLKSAATFNILTSSVDDLAKNKHDKVLTELQKINNLVLAEDSGGMDFFEAVDQRIKDLDNPEVKITTGLKTFDKETNGGWYADGRCLITIVAPSGMGKSLFLSSTVAQYMKRNKFCIIFSLELSERVYASRIDAHLSGINPHNMLTAKESLRQSIKAIREKNPDSILIIKEYPAYAINPSIMAEYTRKQIAKYGRKPDGIFIDYISLINPNTFSKDENTYTKLARASHELRGLSYEFECPVFTAQQVNRSGYDQSGGAPGLDAVSDSMGIVHASDFIATLFQIDTDRDEGVMRCVITKNRFGGGLGHVFKLGINYNNLMICDLDAEPEYTLSNKDFNAIVDTGFVIDAESSNEDLNQI